MASSSFYSNNCSRSVLAKIWRLATKVGASACKICFRGAMSSIVPARSPKPNIQGLQFFFANYKMKTPLKNLRIYAIRAC
jgi:hypothetical protein